MIKEQPKTVRQTIRQLNKKHPEEYVMVSRQYGESCLIFIAPISGLGISGIEITDKVTEAEKWTYADKLSSVKLEYYKTITGYNLQWEKV